MLTRPVTRLPDGVKLARYAKALRFGSEYARAQFRDTPEVAEAVAAIRTKAAVSAISTGAAPSLVQLGIYDPATAVLLAGQSAFEAARGRMRELPFNTPTPREADAGTAGAWVPEGAGLPVVSYFFDRVTLSPTLAGSVVVVTDELLRNPSAEATLRNAILRRQGRTESDLFLSPTLVPPTDAPLPITQQGIAITTTGDVGADLATMLAAISTLGSGLTWIAGPRSLGYIASAGFDVRGGTILGLPALVVPTVSMGLVVLADLAEITYAASPLDVDLSTETAVQMDNAPSNASIAGSPLVPTPTTVVSLYQTNSTGLRVMRFLNWSVPEGAVVYCMMNTGSPP